MSEYSVRVITRAEDMPQMDSSNIFHSPQLFRIMRDTPRCTPYMIVVEDVEGTVLAHMLATIRRRSHLLPAFLMSHVRIYGEGVYADGTDRQALFGLMLNHLTTVFKRNFCSYIEISDLSHKMFGYKAFRDNGYFPVHWQEIHNSLHSKSPEERLPAHVSQLISKSFQDGIVTKEAESDAEVHGFYKMLRGFYRMKLRRLIPPEHHFLSLYQRDACRILLTLYKGKIIGGSCCIYSEGNAYLWYLASKRKTHQSLHPDTISVWHAIEYAYQRQYRHIYFMDVGLPYKNSSFRKFILSFGGKPVGTFRWFRFTLPGVNRLLGWLYKE